MPRLVESLGDCINELPKSAVLLAESDTALPGVGGIWLFYVQHQFEGGLTTFRFKLWDESQQKMVGFP